VQVPPGGREYVSGRKGALSGGGDEVQESRRRDQRGGRLEPARRRLSAAQRNRVGEIGKAEIRLP